MISLFSGKISVCVQIWNKTRLGASLRSAVLTLGRYRSEVNLALALLATWDSASPRTPFGSVK